MDVTSVRRTRLKEWFSHRSIPPSEKSYFSQLINGKAPFGEKSARRIEAQYNLPPMYLDTPAGSLDVTLDSVVVTASGTTDPLREAIDKIAAARPARAKLLEAQILAEAEELAADAPVKKQDKSAA